MVIFHSYVSLPEGISWEKGKLQLPLAFANSGVILSDPGGVITKKRLKNYTQTTSNTQGLPMWVKMEDLGDHSC